MSIMHFGCKVLHPENARLTRENYIDVEKCAKNTFFSRLPSWLKEVILQVIGEMSEQYNIDPTEFSDKQIEEVKQRTFRFIMDNSNLFIEDNSDLIEKDQERIASFIKNLKKTYLSKKLMKEKRYKYCVVTKQFSWDINDWDVLIDDAPLALQFYLSKLNKIKVDNNDVESSILWLTEQLISIPKEIYYEMYFRQFKNRITMPFYRKKEIEKMLHERYQNFDNNMAYFNSIKQEDFDNALNRFQNEFPCFRFIDDLSPYKNVPGAYIMILDQYHQAYIGRTDSGLRNRIMKHWQANIAFDHMIFGNAENSILSIDSFRHFDTTRILVAPYEYYSDMYEQKMVSMPYMQPFLLNRTAGGLHSYEAAMINGIVRPLTTES